MPGPSFDDIRRICLSFPEADEVFVEAWGHPTFRVRNKMFASMGGEDGEKACTFKTEPEEREALLVAGEPWFVPAYVGRYGWMGLHLAHPGAASVTVDELAELLATSWRRTAPKRSVQAFDAGGGAEG